MNAHKKLDASITKWSYRGLDPALGVPEKDLRNDTCLPALVVWMTMTTNPNYVGNEGNDLSPQEITYLSDKLGMTENCIRAIRAIRTTPLPSTVPNEPDYTDNQVADAFLVVARAFHHIGWNVQPKREYAQKVVDGADPYQPDNCPQVADLDILAEAAAASITFDLV